MESLLKQVNPALLKNMNLENLSADDMKQAESIWKMLDDMAKNDEEGYNKFVSKNIKQGVDEIKEKNEKEMEGKKVTVTK
jgi:hypothetical protein